MGLKAPVPSCARLHLIIPAAWPFYFLVKWMFIEIPFWVTELKSFLKQLSPVILKKSSSDFESLIHLMIFYSLFSVHYWVYCLLKGSSIAYRSWKFVPSDCCSRGISGLPAGNFRTLITVRFRCPLVISQRSKDKKWNMNYPLPQWFLQASSAERACRCSSQAQLIWGRHLQPVPSTKFLLVSSILIYFFN